MIVRAINLRAERNVIGLIPAAGNGTRLKSAIPKELVPLTWEPLGGNSTEAIAPIDFAIAQLRVAGIKQVLIVCSPDKRFLTEYLQHRYGTSLELAFIYQRTRVGLPGAIADAAPWLAGRPVALVLPDTLVQPPNALARVLALLQESGCHLSLGVFPTDAPQELGPVQLGPRCRVLDIADKPVKPLAANTWGMACWTEQFTQLLQQMVVGTVQEIEIPLGDLFRAAIQTGFEVYAVDFADDACAASYLDTGTPAKMVAAWRILNDELAIQSTVERSP